MTSREVLAQFDVIGEAASQGSKRLVHPKGASRPMMIEASKKTKPWRDSVSAAAREQVENLGLTTPLDGELELAVLFRFTMPKTRKGPGPVRGWGWRTGPPDLDKLLRPIGDSCQEAGLIANDARICRIVAEKREVVSGWLGCTVTFRRLPK